MDSVLDPAAPADVVRPRHAGAWTEWRAAWGTLLAWTSSHAGSRKRRLQLDPWRVMMMFAVTAMLATAGAWLWTQQQQQQFAHAGAEAALRFVDRRLSAIDMELAAMARDADLPMPLSSCPDALVAQLLQQSLASSLVRRFDLVQVGAPLRCEPHGERQADPLDATPPAGLSIVPGSQLTARPVVLRPLPHGAVLQATLDPYALSLPRSELPPSLLAVPLRMVVQSPPAGALPIWDTRLNPGSSPGTLTATVSSTTHSISVRAQLDQGDLDAAFRRQALWAIAITWLVLTALVAVVWGRAVRRARLSHRLQLALRQRQFVPFVQPIVDLASGQCVGAEVLMRWQHPHRGVLAPGEFIDEAERSGLILGMSDLTMRLAAHQLAALAQAEPRLYFSFNITPGQLRQHDFPRQLAQIFGPATVPRSQVMLELTERDFVDPAACAVLAALRADGWRIAIDDFGTGHSSLGTIEQLAIDRIKIDRAFVGTVDERTVNRPVLDAIIGLARDLGVALIAEGVETRSQWDYLAARGVASAQGYLMARPMAVADFVRWYGRQQPGAATPPLPEAERALWERMRSPGGLSTGSRLHRLRLYRQCFVGAQAVDWIVRERRVSRAEAVRLGRHLLAAGLICHVANEHDFEDDKLFYRLVPPPTETPLGPVTTASLRQTFLAATDLPWRNHRRGVVRHNSCATGRELVDWIVRRQGAPRVQAAQWAGQLMRGGTLRHVFDDRPFRDDATLYRLG